MTSAINCFCEAVPTLQPSSGRFIAGAYGYPTFILLDESGAPILDESGLWIQDETGPGTSPEPTLTGIAPYNLAAGSDLGAVTFTVSGVNLTPGTTFTAQSETGDHWTATATIVNDNTATFTVTIPTQGAVNWIVYLNTALTVSNSLYVSFV